MIDFDQACFQISIDHDYDILYIIFIEILNEIFIYKIFFYSLLIVVAKWRARQKNRRVLKLYLVYNFVIIFFSSTNIAT